MKNKKIPMRSCVVSREKLPKQELLRIVRTTDGSIVADISGKINGRGAYIKKDIEVLDLVYIESNDLNDNPEEAYSGLALVSGVSRIYANKKITTYVSLNREGFNQTK